MGSFVDDILPSLDDIRGIPSEMGLRPYTVTVRVTTWSGARVGLGTATNTDTVITVAAGKYRPKVRSISARDVVASGGRYQAEDIRVGPMTPNHVAVSTIDPATSSSPTEVKYLVVGPGTASGGDWYVRVGDEVDHALHRYVVLRKAGTV